MFNWNKNVFWFNIVYLFSYLMCDKVLIFIVNFDEGLLVYFYFNGIWL